MWVEALSDTEMKLFDIDSGMKLEAVKLDHKMKER